MSPKTLSNWIRQYQDEVSNLMTKNRDETEKLKQDAQASGASNVVQQICKIVRRERIIKHHPSKFS